MMDNCSLLKNTTEQDLLDIGFSKKDVWSLFQFENIIDLESFLINKIKEKRKTKLLLRHLKIKEKDTFNRMMSFYKIIKYDKDIKEAVLKISLNGHGFFADKIIESREGFDLNNVDLKNFIGCGSMGCVFGSTLSTEIVVKVTKDKKEYNLFSKIKEIGNLSGFSKCYKIDSFDGLFFIQKEKVKPVDKVTNSEISLPSCYFDILRMYNLDIIEFCKSYKNIDIDLSLRKIFDSLVTLAKEGYAVSDIFSQNIGLRNNEDFVIYDGWIKKLSGAYVIKK